MDEMHRKIREYQPINSYGVIGNCRSALLIAPDGSVDWGCLPDFDSPAIFCRILDAKRGGYFQIAPTDEKISGSQHYLSGSNVLQTRFASAAGEMILTDFMPVESLIAWPYSSMSNDIWSENNDSYLCLVRIVECVQGELPITAILKVSPNYAASPSEITLFANDSGAVISGGEQHVGLAVGDVKQLPSFSMRFEAQVGEMHASVIVQATLHEGGRLMFVLGMGRTAEAAGRFVESEMRQHNFDKEMEHTLHCWRTWLANCTYQGPYAEWVQRSALVLKMLTYAPTGGVVAAPTTSLPEAIGGERNWDYRYTWLRDGTFSSYVLTLLGFAEEARAFIHWLLRLPHSNGEELQIMYGIRGERDLAERELPHLSGYRDSRPVRTGNGAVNQKQLDVFGEVLDCIHFYRRCECFERYGETLAGPLWEMVHTLVEFVCTSWQEADSGIWEVRGGPRHFVYSKVMCWVALDRGIRAAQELQLEADLHRWERTRDHIRAEIMRHGYNAGIGAFTQSFDDSTLDASILLMPLFGFISPHDPRMRSTVERIIEQLTGEQGFVYRYLSDDGLRGKEGTFTICSFWLVDNLALQDRIAEARELFERLLACAGRLGLFSEEIGSQNTVALGNYPQALTHIALINSAVNLQKAEERISSHGGLA